jgi:hypothetical protein
MFRRILLAFDGSEPARKAFGVTLRSAVRVGR